MVATESLWYCEVTKTNWDSLSLKHHGQIPCL
uniref:Uncharacterized protein n=1 Tax=Rhizophora mucronata TaxID=61149 RepID=A0A2P2R0Z8_RHIMU